jgi:hypothetical protein
LLAVASFSSFQVMGKDRSVVTDQDRQFWSFQPLQKNAAPLASDRWIRSPINGFFLKNPRRKSKTCTGGSQTPLAPTCYVRSNRPSPDPPRSLRDFQRTTAGRPTLGLLIDCSHPGTTVNAGPHTDSMECDTSRKSATTISPTWAGDIEIG